MVRSSVELALLFVAIHKNGKSFEAAVDVAAHRVTST
jgi:hypothetical protein